MKHKILRNCLQIAMDNNTDDKHPEWYAYHHYTFIVQNNKIIDWGTNRRCSPLIYLGYKDHTKMHSEVDAYFKARGLLSKDKPFEAVNIRLTKTYKIRMSMPCNCCFSFLKRAGCKRVWFTTNLENFANLVL